MRLRGRPHRRRAPQGVGQPGSLGAPADQHRRIASPEGDGHRVRARARAATRHRHRTSGRRDHGLLVRRCVVEPGRVARGDQRRAFRPALRQSGARAVRLRGQRDRDLGGDTRALDRGELRTRPVPPLPAGLRGHRRRMGGRGRRDRHVPNVAFSGLPSPRHGASARSRGQRRRDPVPQPRGDRGNRSARPPSRKCETPDRDRSGKARRTRCDRGCHPLARANSLARS